MNRMNLGNGGALRKGSACEPRSRPAASVQRNFLTDTLSSFARDRAAWNRREVFRALIGHRSNVLNVKSCLSQLSHELLVMVRVTARVFAGTRLATRHEADLDPIMGAGKAESNRILLDTSENMFQAAAIYFSIASSWKKCLVVYFSLTNKCIIKTQSETTTALKILSCGLHGNRQVRECASSSIVRVAPVFSSGIFTLA